MIDKKELHEAHERAKEHCKKDTERKENHVREAERIIKDKLHY